METTNVEIRMSKEAYQTGILAVLEHFVVCMPSPDEQTDELSLGLQALIDSLRSTFGLKVITP